MAIQLRYSWFLSHVQP